MPTPFPLPAVCVEDYAGQAERSCYAFMYFRFFVLVFGATTLVTASAILMGMMVDVGSGRI